MKSIHLSSLRHTWLIDIDGTIMVHNGHKTGKDSLLIGVKKFWDSIPPTDLIILLSARTNSEKQETLNFLTEQCLRFDYAIFDLPTGERILINDIKPQGLNTAIAVNVDRNIGLSNLTTTIS